jgi:glycosyltransferase EpsJ
MDEDSQTRRMLQRRYVTNIITTIVSTCSPACNLSEDEKRAHVERVITSDKTQKIASEAAPWSGVVRAMLMPIRRKDVDLAMGEGRIISWISRHTTTLGSQLFS